MESEGVKEGSIFEEFIGKVVKAPYQDNKQFKIARGKLVSAKDGFVKIKGDIGTIIINQKDIRKMSVHKVIVDKKS